MPLFALAFMIMLITAHQLGRLPALVMMIYLVTSLITFIVYGLDKVAARQRMARTPERTLHLLALLGGWPGAVLAQSLFRHKWRKGSFMGTFRLVSAINAGGVIGWLVLR